MRTDDDEVRRRLEEAGLAALTPRVLEGAAGEIWIAVRRQDDFGPTASRIGGVPHLPAGTPWPRHRWSSAEVATWPDYARTELERALEDGTVVLEPDLHGNADGEAAQLARALSFVAQLDLAMIGDARLPPSGHLWLFVDQLTVAGEVDTGQHYQASACVYAEAPGEAASAAPPTLDVLPGYALDFVAGRSFPDANELGLRGDDWHAYQRVLGHFDPGEPHHALFVRSFDASSGRVPPDGLVTLFQIDSDYRGDDVINWGDASFVRFAIRPDDLAARRFSEVRAFRFDG